MLRVIKVALWGTVIFCCSTLAADITFRLISRELRKASQPANLVQSENGGVRLKALARRYKSYSFRLLHLSFLGLGVLTVTGGNPRVSLLRVSLKFTALPIQSCFLWLSGVPEADSLV